MKFGAFREDHSRLLGESYASFYVNRWNLNSLRSLIRKGDLVTYEPEASDQSTWRNLNLPRGTLIRYMHEFNLAPRDQTYWWGRIPSRIYKEKFLDFFAGNERYTQIWSPNVTYPGSLPIDRYYPGRQEVDSIAVDGYDWDGDTSPADIFVHTIDALAEYNKPIMIGETGTSVDHKQPWVGELIRLPVTHVTYFDVNKERDWSLDAHANWPPS